MKEINKKRPDITILALFTLLVVLFYFIGYWLIFRFERATPLMLSVGVATLLTCIITKKDISTLGWGWGKWKYQWLSYLIPFTLILSTFLICWFLNLGEWYDTDFVELQKTKYNLADWNDFSLIIFHLAASASISFILLLPSVLSEEIAWRGLLVPELSKFMRFTGVSLISGLIWSLWHWPLIIIGLSGNNVTPIYYQLLCFTVFLTSISFAMTYLRLKSNSLWTAVIFHMSLNIFLQKVFEPLTKETSLSPWFLGENGAAIAIISLPIAVFFWLKGRKEL